MVRYASQETRLYAEPGSQVTVDFNPKGLNLQCVQGGLPQGSISGYLVDVP